MSYVTATRIFKNGPDGDRLNLEMLPHIGYQSTHSKNSTVTDSAAAASAWATGEKYNNGEISCHDDDFDGACDPGTTAPTLLDIAQSMGKATGLVVTSDITHATPAAFASTVHHRKCEEEIARQYVRRNIDVLLGGGIEKNRGPCLLPDSPGDYLDLLLHEANTAGYTVVRNKAEMEAAVAGGASKLMGLFRPGGKTKELFRIDPTVIYPETEPTLPEMTKAALDILEEDEDGFFCLIEGSQIDWAGHANDRAYLLGEMLAFEDAVRIVQEWIETEPFRRLDTLIVVVADHETGGMMINGPADKRLQAGDIVETGWTSREHTAQDTIIWSQGPGSWRLGRAIDNTDLYGLIVDALD
jgi:alkaline phosphatase